MCCTPLPPLAQPSGALTPGAKGLALNSLSSRNGSKSGGAAGSEYHRAAADKGLFWRHFWALFVKRFHYTRRDSKAWVFQLVIPIAALVRHARTCFRVCVTVACDGARLTCSRCLGRCRRLVATQLLGLGLLKSAIPSSLPPYVAALVSR